MDYIGAKIAIYSKVINANRLNNTYKWIYVDILPGENLSSN